MQIIYDLIVLVLLVISFAAGMAIDNRYHEKTSFEVKDALERQYLRLRAKADADDPCKPYGTPQIFQPIPLRYNTGDFDGDRPINEEFMDRLKTNKQASVKISKANISK